MDHAGALWNAVERSLPELRVTMSWAASSTPASISEYAQRAAAGWESWTTWDWVIYLEDQVAGAAGLNRYDEMWASANLGYWIRSDLAGRGIATEAARAVVGFGFGQVGLNRMELVAAVDNAASQRVAEKLGFRYEGTKREGTIVDGRGIDVRMYGLLAADPRD